MNKKISRWLVMFLGFIPGGIGIRARAALLPFQRKNKNLLIREFCYFEHIGQISLGERVSINQRTIINGGGGVCIGDNVLIGPRVTIYSVNHEFMSRNQLIADQGMIKKSVRIENDVWIGAGSIILPGVLLGKGCVVAAGSIVTKNVAEYAVVAGNPAKVIKFRV